MTDQKDYKYWYEKALEVIKPGSISPFIDEYLAYSLKLNPYQTDSWILYAGYHNTLSNNDKVVEIINDLFRFKSKKGETGNPIEFIMNKIKYYTNREPPIEHNSRERFPDTEYSIRYCGEWLIAAVGYWKESKFDAALGAFEKSFSYPLNKNRAILWYIHLEESYKKGEYKKAIEAGEKAVELDPKFNYAWVKLSEVYISNKDYNNAMNCIEAALKNNEIFEPAIKLKEE
ncbi:MAG: tetratricopeptide repeat protein, partial [Promethearchaeota archaeon]